MEGLSIAANGLAIVSVAFQLTEACIKLYWFWESVDDAPQEIEAIREDLQYLISVFERVESDKHYIGECVAKGVQHCRIKVLELTAIVENLEAGFQSSSRRKRKWTALRAATRGKHLQRFRESLGETKSTLTLALVHQCVVQSQTTYTISMDANLLRSSRYDGIAVQANSTTVTKNLSKGRLSGTHRLITSTADEELRSIQRLPVTASHMVKRVLKNFEQSVPDPATAGLRIKELMLHAMRQTAIATLESNSLEIFAQDGYTLDTNGFIRSRTFVYSESLRYRVRHQTTRFRTAFGCVTIRKTIIYLQGDAGDNNETPQSVTSTVFYPMNWLQCFGVKRGLEAIVASGNQHSLFNCRLTVTRAIPEDSLIFKLCKEGETRAVELLLSEGRGSVVDTSPKGWKPLHFAAAHGHPKLCAMLIEAGADKSALVYEGPTTSILSPISLFVACATEVQAEDKISMLRLFSDCFDLTDPNGDAWTVHEWLKRTFAKERVPISQSSITWLLYATSNEEFLELYARIAWSGLQHAVRSILCHERYSCFLEQILGFPDGHKAISQRHLNAMGSLMALRVSGQVLLPMVTAAGSFLQIKGFDWVQDDMTHEQCLQALPPVYRAWCHAVLDCVENGKEYIQTEFEQCLRQLGLTRDLFIDAISHQDTLIGSDIELLVDNACTRCGDKYHSLAGSLVAPGRIALVECVLTGHHFDCVCQKVYKSDLVRDNLPDYAGLCLDESIEEDLYTEEEFHDAEPYPLSISDLSTQNPSDIFSNVATLLYRAQGRAWIGEYSAEDRLCTICFLHNEGYTDEDGLIDDFRTVPERFTGLRFSLKSLAQVDNEKGR